MGLLNTVLSTAGAAGDLFSSALQYSNAEQNRSQQRSMSNTQYQRSMSDMRKAGLNPIIGAAKGPGGTPTAGSPMGATRNPVAAAMEVARQKAEINRVNAETGFINKKTQALGPMSELGTSTEGLIKQGVETFKTFGEFLGSSAAQVQDYSAKQINSLKQLWNKHKKIDSQKRKYFKERKSGKSPLRIEIKKHSRSK